jgi:hypothetical protein
MILDINLAQKYFLLTVKRVIKISFYNKRPFNTLLAVFMEKTSTFAADIFILNLKNDAFNHQRQLGKRTELPHLQGTYKIATFHKYFHWQ